MFLIVDGNNMLIRNFFGSRNQLPEHCKGVCGFFNSLNYVINQNRITHVFIAWDTHHTYTWRRFLTRIYSYMYDNDVHPLLYKQIRDEKAPIFDVVREQKNIVQHLLKTMGFYQFQSSKKVLANEADDIMGAVAKNIENVMKVLVYTSDKDMVQIISPNISIFNPVKGLITVKNAYKVMGVKPDQIVDYLILRGDHEDSVLGVPGIGEKTAKVLLQKYGNLENILNNKHNITGIGGKSLKSCNHVDLEFTRRLVALNYNAYKPNIDKGDLRIIKQSCMANKSKIVKLKEKYNINYPLIYRI